MSDANVSENEGFTEALSSLSRRLLNASKRTCSTVISSARETALTVLFVATAPTASVSKLSKHRLSLFWEV